MTALILGTANIGLAYGKALERALPNDMQTNAVFAAAHASGFLALDTAAAYGSAEQRIGNYHLSHPQNALAVHTKLPPDIDRADLLGDALSASEHALGANPTQILLHRWDQKVRDGGALWRGLCEAREAGRTAQIGVSVQSPQEALAALKDPEIDVIQLACNMLDWRYETRAFIEAVSASRARIEVRSVFLQGLLTLDPAMRWPALSTPYDPKSITSAITEHAQRWVAGDPVALSLRFALSLEWVDALVLGADTPDQVHSLAKIACTGALPAEAVADIRARRPHVHRALLDPSSWL